MSDLISRKKVISVLEQLEEHSLSGKMDISNAIYLLENQQTAYSVDKVIEELESNSFITVKQEEVQTKRKDIQSYISVEKEVVLLKDAIEIVKQGSVSDDVCEWKLDGVYLHSPHKPLVSCVTDENYRYYYCPYCGKKIKVVE